jgi:hypothetical protein
VREDYSPHGNAWDYFPHDHARSRAYRWGEDAIAGISDAWRRQGRNRDWVHLNNADIISMPDKWEYPWYAAWDLAFGRRMIMQPGAPAVAGTAR